MYTSIIYFKAFKKGRKWQHGSLLSKLNCWIISSKRVNSSLSQKWLSTGIMFITRFQMDFTSVILATATGDCSHFRVDALPDLHAAVHHSHRTVPPVHRDHGVIVAECVHWKPHQRHRQSSLLPHVLLYMQTTNVRQSQQRCRYAFKTIICRGFSFFYIIINLNLHPRSHYFKLSTSSLIPNFLSWLTDRSVMYHGKLSQRPCWGAP